MKILDQRTMRFQNNLKVTYMDIIIYLNSNNTSNASIHSLLLIDSKDRQMFP